LSRRFRGSAPVPATVVPARCRRSRPRGWAPGHPAAVAAGGALQLYLREIGKPVAAPAEEIALSKRIRRGDEAAREQMIKANLRLVVKIARDYEAGPALLDLINEGNIGLMKV
jgi:RNA polymerase primary sigma factor